MSQKIFNIGKWIAHTAVAFSLCSTGIASAEVITFEDLSLGVSGDGSTAYGSYGYYWNGSGKSALTPNAPFTTGGGAFVNNYNFDWSSWEGFAYSNTTNNATGGFGNQYSAITGSGVGGSSNYAVGFPPFSEQLAINYSGLVDLTGGGLYVTNTSYTYYSMLNGDAFSKKFGGVSGNDADWFVLSITGWNGGVSTGTVDFYLADFRFSDNSQDYIVNTWEFVDLSALGSVDKLTFGFDSSDVGGFGINTPTYVAIDNVSTVPEPSAALLAAIGLAGVLIRRQRRTFAA